LKIASKERGPFRNLGLLTNILASQKIPPTLFRSEIIQYSVALRQDAPVAELKRRNGARGIDAAVFVVTRCIDRLMLSLQPVKQDVRRQRASAGTIEQRQFLVHLRILRSKRNFGQLKP
jgi:hypothetical protein